MYRTIRSIHGKTSCETLILASMCASVVILKIEVCNCHQKSLIDCRMSQANCSLTFKNTSKSIDFELQVWNCRQFQNQSVELSSNSSLYFRMSRAISSFFLDHSPPASFAVKTDSFAPLVACLTRRGASIFCMGFLVVFFLL